MCVGFFLSIQSVQAMPKARAKAMAKARLGKFVVWGSRIAMMVASRDERERVNLSPARTWGSKLRCRA